MVRAMEPLSDLSTSTLRRRALLLSLLGADLTAGYLATRYMILHSGRAFPGSGIFSLGARFDTDKLLVAPFQRALYLPSPFLELGGALGLTILVIMSGSLAAALQKKFYLAVSSILTIASLFGVSQIVMFVKNDSICIPSMAHYFFTYVACALAIFSYKRALHPDIAADNRPLLAMGALHLAQFTLWQLVWAVPFWRGILAP